LAEAFQKTVLNQAGNGLLDGGHGHSGLFLYV
jgi:hypothetical protein